MPRLLQIKKVHVHNCTLRKCLTRVVYLCHYSVHDKDIKTNTMCNTIIMITTPMRSNGHTISCIVSNSLEIIIHAVNQGNNTCI